MALGSGIGIITQPFLKINPLAAIALGEGAGLLLDTAQQKHALEQEALHDWHMALVRRDVGKFTEAIIAKSGKGLTDQDRIRLALFVEWGFITEESARLFSPKIQAEILLTELAIAVRQSGMSSVKLAENFSFPQLQHNDPSPETLKMLLADKLCMHEILTQKNKPPVSGKMQQRLLRGCADAAVNVLTKPKGLTRSSVSVLMDYSSLRRIWDIISAKGPAHSGEMFLDRLCKDLQPVYQAGFNAMRRAQRRQLRSAGIPFESVLVPKPEGGTRHIVRPRKASGKTPGL